MMNKESSFGGRRSVMFTENEPMLIMIGHDDVIFRQNDSEVSLYRAARSMQCADRTYCKISSITIFSIFCG